MPKVLYGKVQGISIYPPNQATQILSQMFIPGSYRGTMYLRELIWSVFGQTSQGAWDLPRLEAKSDKNLIQLLLLNNTSKTFLQIFNEKGPLQEIKHYTPDEYRIRYSSLKSLNLLTPLDCLPLLQMPWA
ncbi:hypothetical protein CEXT_76471 [Caerostris extrusa]|uniref:Uncharacterized protein n=1 Tax=Caerostris extrusa TaxID=172846 RepID=A0AAV4XZJ0_CAEEX|nr:hypothetical protein CEXT_76471 [Caerostris extrusa]